MASPRICAAIVNQSREAIERVEPLVDLFEVRIDLIGAGWAEVAKTLHKPWIACNRLADEGGRWAGSESERIAELIKAIELGAAIVDIELRSPNLAEAVKVIKAGADCLLSHHDLTGTPPPDDMKAIIRRQLDAGADIGKLVTTARRPEDNLSVLGLIGAFPESRIVAFAMGEAGTASRIFCPLVGGDFTYASTGEGMESAPGQLSAGQLRKLYEMVKG